MVFRALTINLGVLVGNVDDKDNRDDYGKGLYMLL